MPINAYEKIKKSIYEHTEKYDFSFRKITDETELEKILEKGAGNGYNLKIMKALYNLLNVYAEEYTYDNGLIYLSTVFTYKDKDDTNSNNIKRMRMILVTNDYNKDPFINIVESREIKSIHQLLVDSTPSDKIIPESMKNIEVHHVSVQINNKSNAHFETYKDRNTNSLLLEKYMSYYPISNYEDSTKDLLRLCGCGARYLEIIYNESKPIYAQLSKKYKVEIAGFDPNSALDAEKIVNKINEEVDAITNAINSIFDEQEQKTKSNRQVKSLRKDN